MNAYLEMRERQMLKQARHVQEKDVADMDMPENEEDKLEVSQRRYIGVTRMDKVHARKPCDRKLIALNHRFQPVAADKKVIVELSNFLGTISRQYVPLNCVNWHKVPENEKDAYWTFVLDRYIILEEGRPWVMRAIGDAWRLDKSRTKAKHYTPYHNDDDIIVNRPDKIPLKEFKAILEYWGDEHVHEVAAKNSTSRSVIGETHTAGTTSFAQVRNEMSDAKKIIISTEESDTAEKLFSDAGTSHGPSWLIGRYVKNVKQKNVGKDNYVQQLTSEIRKQLAEEMEEKLNKKMQENLRKVLRKLGEANPNFNLDVEELYTSNCSDGDDGTPMTQVTRTEGTNGNSS